MSKTRASQVFIPIIISVSIIAGIVVGFLCTKYYDQGRLGFVGASSNKIDALLHIIDEDYVDSISMPQLVEDAMPQILAELDPHSYYIPAKDQEEATEKIEGSFSGVGISYTIQKDTINIMKVIPGGPSDKVGLMAGDRIVAVNDTAFVGSVVTDASSKKKLKGPRGTSVKITVYRPALKRNLDFTVQRDNVSINSIDSYYMITDRIGYMKINSFSMSTYEEMIGAIAHLKYKKCNGLIIDLRGNLGGVMDVAAKMANEFLPEGRLIVYAEGRNFPRQNYVSDGYGTCTAMPLVVLIDEGSASSSEIFAGAIQDNDRGMIVGRRSFGKGLVQKPIDFRDGSQVRITIARYHTPSGRCIQRPYVKGDTEDYDMDIVNRYEHGEFFSKDSVKFDQQEAFQTTIGRTVYGGGGVMPDIFIPQDTIGYTSYLTSLVSSGLIGKFAFEYYDENRSQLRKYAGGKELAQHLDKASVVNVFARYAETNGIKRRYHLLNKSQKLLKRFLYAAIIYNVFDMDEYIRYVNEDDNCVRKAVELIENGESTPTIENDGKQK